VLLVNIVLFSFKNIEQSKGSYDVAYHIVLTIIMVFKGQDAWRSHPLFQGLWKSPFPGFRNAVVIFGVYMAIDYAIQSTKPKPAAHIQHH
jgi:hypothetical protein